ncbi:hypothetical protein [Pendulispora albinea]|uniref:Uncharacterized protein n=1 Tax=Pendulispora albinea TaxID=2741071 RepID=A0ABZ2M4E8_9BACT
MSAGGRVHVVVMREKGGDWAPASFGNSALIELVQTHREALASARGVRSVLLIDIPALHTAFLGRDESGALFLTPLQDVEDAKLRAGTPARAADAFPALAPVAIRMEGLLPR